MKIGIMTFWWSNDNYGQLLQCYALQKYLRNLGHEPFLIRYKSEEKQRFSEKIKIFIKKILSVFIKRYRYLLDESKQQKINEKQNVSRFFEAFRSNYLSYTDQIYHSLDELRNNPPDADAYIVGSDQVFGGRVNTSPYYLDFGNSKIKRLSYAASGNIPTDIQSFKKELEKYTIVGVRERTLCNMLIANGIHADVNIDPTMLLSVDEYPIDKPMKDKGYIFLYILNVLSKEEFYFDTIRRFADNRNINMKITYSSGTCAFRNFDTGYGNQLLSIPEWLGTIKSADYVVTTSFHGVVFCILNHKMFLVILLTNQWTRGNRRITDLLENLGLLSRIFKPKKSFNEQINSPIDWDIVEGLLEQYRNESDVFLKRGLQGDI